VGDDARLAGLTVRVDGDIAGNLLALGQSLQLGPKSRVRREAILSGSEVLVTGSLEQSLKILSRSATLGGHVQGNVRIIAEDIVVLKDARIDGDLVYTSSKELFLDDQVQLGGRLIRQELPQLALEISLTRFIWLQVYFFLAALLTGLPLIGLFPVFTARAVRAVRQMTVRSGLVGLVCLWMIPAAAYFALWSVIGVPLGLLLLAGFLFMAYTSKIYVAIALGSLILRRQGPQSFPWILLVLLAGLLPLYVLTSLPYVGNIVWLGVLFVGSGAVGIGLLAGERAPWVEPGRPAR
jgi:cytoskeletal protein CcmA (bactofilin family)